jgi:hypothetical protein
VLDRLEPGPDEIEVPADASPLDFLPCGLSRCAPANAEANEGSRSCVAVVHPKLAVSVTLDSFGTQMEELAERRGMRTVIDASPKVSGSE